MIRDLRDSLLSLVYPQECRVCGHKVKSLDDGVACENCWAATKIFNGSEMLCSKCGAFSLDQPITGPATCHHCREHAYDRAFAVGVYEKAIATTIVRLKSEPVLSARVRRLVTETFRRVSALDVDTVVPLPLSKQRRLERGFNQAEVIATAVSDTIGAPVDSFSLQRHLHAPIHRAGMDRRARELSIQNAFAVTRPKLITGKRILLIDDVLTSGASASFCAKALKKHGAASVTVFTMARAVMR